jgi:cytidylate kinase
MAVIAIHRKYGSGGRKLGGHLARKLNYDYVDKYLFQKVAENLQVSEGKSESDKETLRYRISDIFSRAFSKHYIERIVAYDETVVEESEYQDALRALVLGVAEQDNVVIIGRAAHFFLKDMRNCYRLRLVALKNWRRKHAKATLGVRPSEVERILAEKDKNNSWFLHTICGEGFDDPHLFHLTLNMDLVPFEQAVEFALMLAK